MDTIEYFEKDNYGRTDYYLKDVYLSKLVTYLTGKKTVTLVALRVLAELTGKTPKQVLR